MSVANLTLSFVIPCFNEEEIVAEMVRRVGAVGESVFPGKFEIVIVDDGSSDRTWDLVAKQAEQRKAVCGLRLSRNFGHQIALTAGLEHCRGDLVFVLDGDLQDPPELLESMMAKLNEGYDVVYGQRSSRESESLFKRSTAYFFYRLIARFSEVSIPRDTGDFRLMRRAVVEALLRMPERDRFVRGMVAWLGFRQTSFSFERKARQAGVTKYPIRRMFRFAVDAIVSFSSHPLKVSGYFGFVSGSLSLLMLVYFVVAYFASKTVPGWASLAVLVTFFSSVQLISLGIIGEYLGRIYMEGKRRPLYFLQETTGRQELQ